MPPKKQDSLITTIVREDETQEAIAGSRRAPGLGAELRQADQFRPDDLLFGRKPYHVVGEKFFTCNAQTIMDGEVTPYYEVRIGGKC